MVDFFSNDLFGATDQTVLAVGGSNPAVARLASGGYVVSYTIGNSIKVQRYDANGVAIGNADILGFSGNDTDPSIIGLANGGYAVSWVSSPAYVSVRVFDDNGVATTNTFGVGTPSNYQQQPTITALNNGDFVVAWTFNGSSSSIRAQVFHANGQAASGEIIATAATSSNKYYPQAVALTDGGFVLSWTSSFDANGGGTVYAQSYDATGSAQGSIVRIANVVSYHDNFFPSIAALPSGRYILTWTEAGDGGGGVNSKVMGQIYFANGVPASDRFQVNSNSTYNAGQSNVSALSDGNFLVTWKLDVPGGGPNYFQTGDIMAQLFDAQGQKIGAEYRVNQITELGQDLPVVVSFGTGDAAMFWRTFNSSGQSTIAFRTLSSATNGTDLDDVLTGTVGIDYIRGLAGNDTINASEGNDFLDGGTGINALFGHAGNDTLVVGAGADGTSVDGGTGNDKLVISGSVALGGLASIESLEFSGGAGLNLTGTQFATGLASNTSVSGTGSITVNMDAGINFLSQNFVFSGSGVTVTVNGTSGIDIIKCGTGVHIINSGDGVDQIRGGTSADTINAGAGNDKIIGFTGADIITGGTGNDQFRYLLASDSGLGAAADRITDYTIGQDRLNFSGLDTNPGVAGIQGFAFVANGAFSGGGTASIRYTNSGADLLVQADVNGDGIADMEIILQGLNGGTLTGGDFIL